MAYFGRWIVAGGCLLGERMYNIEIDLVQLQVLANGSKSYVRQGVNRHPIAVYGVVQVRAGRAPG